MKSFFATALLLASTSALADCPQISDDYDCTDYTTQIRYRNEPGVTIYTVGTQEIYTDGQPRPITWGPEVKGTYSATCTPENTVRVAYLFTFEQLQQPQVANTKTYQQVNTYKVDGESIVVETKSSTIDANGNETAEGVTSVTCTKIPWG